MDVPGLLPGCVPWALSGSGAVCGEWMGALSRAVLLQREANLHASKLCGANGHYRAPPFLQGATRCWSAWCAGLCCTTSTSRAVCTASPSPLMAGMAYVLRMGRYGGLALARVDLEGSLWEPVPGPGVGRPDSHGTESRLLQGAPGAAPPSATPGLAWLTAGVMASR